jgi:hypothetical protein
LELNYDVPLSTFAFKFNLRRYNKVDFSAPDLPNKRQIQLGVHGDSPGVRRHAGPRDVIEDEPVRGRGYRRDIGPAFHDGEVMQAETRVENAWSQSSN